METRDAKKYNLKDATIHICPACGVVNPAGPSDGCPHLQIVRFEGVDEALEELVMEVAIARKAFAQKTSTLKRMVMAKVQEGTASVQTPRRIKASEVDKLYSEANNGPFSLSHPVQKSAKAKTSNRSQANKKKKAAASPLDSRQLDLLAYSPSKGDA